MKSRINTIRNKRLVISDHANDIDENEIAVVEENGFINLYEYSNGVVNNINSTPEIDLDNTTNPGLIIDNNNHDNNDDFIPYIFYATCTTMNENSIISYLINLKNIGNFLSLLKNVYGGYDMFEPVSFNPAYITRMHDEGSGVSMVGNQDNNNAIFSNSLQELLSILRYNSVGEMRVNENSFDFFKGFCGVCFIFKLTRDNRDIYVASNISYYGEHGYFGAFSFNEEALTEIYQNSIIKYNDTKINDIPCKSTDLLGLYVYGKLIELDHINGGDPQLNFNVTNRPVIQLQYVGVAR